MTEEVLLTLLIKDIGVVIAFKVGLTIEAAVTSAINLKLVNEIFH